MSKPIAAAVLLAVALAPMSLHAQEAEVTANAGWVSQYYYRGIPQKNSSASVGLDLAVGGLYLGTWSADVGRGAEVDLYGGYGIEWEALSLSAGGTGYFYTGEYDETYLEVNLGAGLGPLGVEYSFGQYDTNPEQDYWFLAVTGELEGLYGTFGTFGQDFEGSYAEVGYGFGGGDLFDFSISGIWSDSDLSFEVDDMGKATDELTLVFGVGATFSLLP